jgi:hypothetical protein
LWSARTRLGTGVLALDDVECDLLVGVLVVLVLMVSSCPDSLEATASHVAVLLLMASMMFL